MELLYIWFNQLNSIKKQGFNFSSQYKFDLRENLTTGKYELNYKENEHYISNFFDESGIVENVTAIVGANGSGKTTLLQAIHGMECYPKKDEKGELSQSHEDDQKLFIYKEDNEIIIYHNLNPEDLNNKTNFKVIEYYKYNSELRDTYSNLSHFKNITSIYLTNSSYANNNEDYYSVSGKSINEVSLTPNSISLLSSSFFKDLLSCGDFINCMAIAKVYSEIRLKKTERDFQAICDILYLDYLFKTGKYESFQGKIKQDFKLRLHFIGNYMNRDISVLSKYKWNPFFEQLDRNNINCNSGIEVLYYNLLVELLLFDLIKSDEIIEQFELEKQLDIINNKIDSINNTKMSSYVKNALQEISYLENILKVANDVAMEEMIISNQSKEQYKKIMSFISQCVQHGNSFILKYLSIEGIGMSSGERAYQNMFSWLNLLSFFHQIDSNIEEGLKKNILLLIDEVDLYAHPEWQRMYLFNLLDEIKKQFQTYKVQIIFTTHSPLVLSDIPRYNTIYLNKFNENIEIRDYNSVNETFATNLYLLLNDAFYLKSGEIGEFAVRKINLIIEKLKIDKKENKERLSKSTLIKLRKEINLIGDDLIRSKLQIMLDEYSQEFYPVDVIEELEYQMQILEERIKRLQKGSI